MEKKLLKQWTRIGLVICGVALGVSMFVPMWSIYLQAPQYPEGLSMFLWPYKITGDYQIINGLNHYIGMKTIHQEDFYEFKILPYALGFFALLCFIAAFLNTKKWLYIATALFMIFGVAFMVDFYMWEYNYGHNLDPHAAIIVPGMSYQPPLLGSKQLLNFVAYSYPNIGGAIMIGVAAILAILAFIEFRKPKTV
ncbi:hypothetical protein [Kaistella jeonii]|uniref:Membrane protein n=1 Tax=Kaistella jeonii TaxID=266749 RepID=A0A0C1CYZ0_9FLAO|nr:hypothetical protein [Kaistella jeonii]KIA89616.1 membrane protein [Kaistella jeonii]SFB89844.1 hypothetical protein SAMN05421876_103298 [Kaistella jeonii]VEI95829.1 Uncharacterised protein [Kaistella jeonii]